MARRTDIESDAIVGDEPAQRALASAQPKADALQQGAGWLLSPNFEARADFPRHTQSVARPLLDPHARKKVAGDLAAMT